MQFIIVVILLIMFLYGNSVLFEWDVDSFGISVLVAIIFDIIIGYIILVPIIQAVKNSIKQRKRNKILEQIKVLEQEKSYLIRKNEHLADKINNQNRVINIIDLIKYCGADTSSIEDNPAVNGIMELSNEIKENEISIEQYSTEINYLNKILKEG